jgi:LmbE family N-acetylglucosaminyl deacetylase
MMDILGKTGKVLVLGAHPDDELGCGGVISKLLKQGVEVHHWYFSLCEESLQAVNLPVEQLQKECEKSRSLLGINPENCGNFTFPVRYFPQHRQQILEEMVLLNRRIEPDLVLVPNQHDVHQDHHTIYEESVRAFKYRSILGYELPWNTLTFNHDCLISLEEADLQAKLRAVECYKSQLQRNYANIDFFQSLARVRGVQANTMYAECCEVIRVFL